MIMSSTENRISSHPAGEMALDRPAGSSGKSGRTPKLDYSRLFLRFMEMADVKPGQRILDIAFNTSSLALQMLRMVEPGGRIVCLGFTDEMVERSRAEARTFGLAVENRIEWRKASLDQFPFEDSQFDLVTCMVGLRYLNCESFVAEAWRVLTPQGRLVVSELALRGTRYDPLILRWRRFFERYLRRDRDEATASLYSADQLGDMLRAAGFDQVFIRGLERPWFGHFPVHSVIRALKIPNQKTI
jgi:ubiquinone/menaquinone biosynthesis C-methylase UbiE